MPHNHNIVDDDHRFTIDVSTRAMTNASGTTVHLMQYDHNSERLTFEMPRYIETHDMSISNRVQIHYTNTGTGTSVSNRATNSGIYEVTDLQVDPENEDAITFSWLLSQNATMYAGTVKFQIKFKCYNEVDPSVIEYIWGTNLYSNISVTAGIDSSDAISSLYPDILLQHDARLTVVEEITDAVENEERFLAIEKQLADLSYEAINIKSFTNNVNNVELGVTVTDVTFTWTLNKAASVVSLEGVAQGLTVNGSYTATGLSVKLNKTWTLTVIDERGATATKTTSVTFLNGVYYGVSNLQDAIDSAFVLTLSKTLRNSKLSSFTVAPGIDEYIYYCIPTRFGICEFTVGGFTGGFTLVDTIDFTNASGYTEKYYVYRSNNANLGNTTVNVK